MTYSLDNNHWICKAGINHRCYPDPVKFTFACDVACQYSLLCQHLVVVLMQWKDDNRSEEEL
jgi:hypothetical protein